ncbi:MAG: L-fuculose-phosphate aldolase [Solirubrobacteraceae bacterium]|jgi:L-fuculose-phosphate aldolase|nr:L-fuculose-phosphate aldolase [Solirubrobacteraceae bacterium]
MHALRTSVADASRRLAAAGLVRGTSGNVSARDGELVAITPTGAKLESLSAEDIAVITLSGEQQDGALAPTSEVDLHLSVYARYDTGAVVHTHAPAATALGCVVDELPCIHYEMLLLGGPVRVAPYATFGTPELAASVVAALDGRTAALLANHGTVTHGPDLDAAVAATEMLEWASELYARAAALGTPRALDAAELAAVVEAVTTRRYGTTHAV